MKRISTLMITLMALLMLPLSANGQVDVANIAAFNAVEDGTLVKLTLTNARVNALNSLASPATYYIEDASGATAVKGISLTTGKLLNGYIVGTKATEDVDFVNDPSQGYEYSLNVENPTLSSFTTSDATMTGTSMTIAEACKQENYGKLVTLSNVTIAPIGNGKNLQLTDASGSMKTRDLLFALPWDYEWPNKATSFTGIVLYYMTGWFLMPISADAIVAAPAEFDFLNNNMELPIGSATDINAGNLGGKSIKNNDVTLFFVNASTMPTRYYFNAGKNQLQAIAGSQLRFTAAEGRAITKIVITPVASTNNKWAVDGEVGTLSTDKLTWEGNTTNVRFTANGALYLTDIVITTAPKDGSTISPEYNDPYTEVANLAAFNALEKGTLAKLNLSNAIITSGMVNDWGYYVQDATGAAHFYCTGLEFNVNDVLNGFIYVKKDFNQPGPRIAMTDKTNADNLEITHDGTYTPVEGTIGETVIAANNNRVIKLTDVAVKGTSETDATITSGSETLAISNGKTNFAPYVYQENLSTVDYAKATVVGILWSNTAGTTFKLYPLSITDTTTGIHGISTNEENNENVVIYNLQGVRQNGLKKGINIVNGKKIIVR